MAGGRAAATLALAALATVTAVALAAAAAPLGADACDAASDPASCAGPVAAAPFPAPDSLDYFPGVPKRIEYKGPQSPDPFSYRYYDADEVICAPAPSSLSAKPAAAAAPNAPPLCQPMKDWLRMSVAFWHSMRADGSDPFGHATKRWLWGAAAGGGDARLDEMQLAFRAMHANFQLLNILGLEFWSFHDR